MKIFETRKHFSQNLALWLYLAAGFESFAYFV